MLSVCLKKTSICSNKHVRHLLKCPTITTDNHYLASCVLDVGERVKLISAHPSFARLIQSVREKMSKFNSSGPVPSVYLCNIPKIHRIVAVFIGNLFWGQLPSLFLSLSLHTIIIVNRDQMQRRTCRIHSPIDKKLRSLLHVLYLEFVCSFWGTSRL